MVQYNFSYQYDFEIFKFKIQRQNLNSETQATMSHFDSQSNDMSHFHQTQQI